MSRHVLLFDMGQHDTLLFVLTHATNGNGSLFLTWKRLTVDAGLVDEFKDAIGTTITTLVVLEVHKSMADVVAKDMCKS